MWRHTLTTILDMLHQITKLSFSLNKESTVTDHMLEAHHSARSLHPCFHMTWLKCSFM